VCERRREIAILKEEEEDVRRIELRQTKKAYNMYWGERGGQTDRENK
jgi:hypothetical protein